MPIGFSSTDTLWIRLDGLDKAKPEAERARFKVRMLTSGQVKKIEQLRSESTEADTATARDEKLNAAILIGIVGWENLRDGDGNLVPFSPAALDEFTELAKYRITSEYPTQVFFAEGDLKNSSSHLPQNPAGSTPEPAPATASAETART